MGNIDLAQLQNLCKRDPNAYEEEFLMQAKHFENQIKIFELNPKSNFKEFQEQVSFLSHVAASYPAHMKNFGLQVSSILEKHSLVMNPDLRKALVKSLILLRNKNLLDPIQLLSLFFKLFRCPDKTVRVLLYTHIISDIKKMNAKHRNNKVNNSLQNFMFSLVQDTNEIAARKALDVMIHLYRTNVWNDAKTVNAISLGIFSKNTKMIMSTIQFFLEEGSNKNTGEDSDSEEDKKKEKEKEKAIGAPELYKKFAKGSKKTRSKKKKLEKALKQLKAHSNDKKKKNIVNFPAIELLNDPHGYAKKVFGVLKHTTEKFEVRLMMMNFISRLIAIHQLMLYKFFAFLTNYIQPKQRNVAYILAVLAQACHPLVDPDVLSPIVKKLANEFVNDRSSNEVVTIGLNTIREICTRCPLALDADLLQDLTGYKRYKDKGVVMAARSLINVYRTSNPAMLKKKDRGKDHDPSTTPLSYGQMKVQTSVPDIELLEQDLIQRALQSGLQINPLEEHEDDWKIASEDEEDDDESGWIDVNHDEEGDIEIDLSSDEEEDEDKQDEGEDAEEGEESEEDEENEEVSEDDEDKDEIEEDDEEDEDDENEEDEENAESESIPTSGTQTPSSTPSTPNSLSQIALQLDRNKIITPAEWERIKQLKKAQKNSATKSRKRKPSEAESPSTNSAGPTIVDISDIQRFQKRQRMEREERIASIKAGQEGREPYGSKLKNKEKKGGTTNEQKKVTKPFMLVKNKRQIKAKQKRSSKQRASVMKKHRQKLKGIKKFGQ